MSEKTLSAQSHKTNTVNHQHHSSITKIPGVAMTRFWCFVFPLSMHMHTRACGLVLKLLKQINALIHFPGNSHPRLIQICYSSNMQFLVKCMCLYKKNCGRKKKENSRLSRIVLAQFHQSHFKNAAILKKELSVPIMLEKTC